MRIPGVDDDGVDGMGGTGGSVAAEEESKQGKIHFPKAKKRRKEQK